MEVSGGGRRRRSLSDENIDSPNLRDFLRVKEDGSENSYPSGGGQTLAAVLSQKQRQPEPNRTLLDIIRDDPNTSHNHDGGNNRKTWRTFKDKIRLRRAGAAWTSSVPTPASDVPIPSSHRVVSRRQSTRFPAAPVSDDSADPYQGFDQNLYQNPYQSGVEEETNRAGMMNSMPSSRAMMMRQNSSRLPSLSTASYGRGAEFSTSFNPVSRTDDPDSDENDDDDEDAEEERESEEEGEEPQVRMSLMALLAETDRQMGLDGSPFMMGDEDEDEDEDEQSSGVGEYNNCCVCMVRHKGAAFIPCGHTFCRLCSRELWVQRGNCPLCNNFILEILDIF